MYPHLMISKHLRNRVATIRNIANVCCVQFSAHSTHLPAFGSADYRTYCYDLRNWCILTGHEKAISYVKFLDSQTVVTASTDNTLKLWDLTRSSSNTLSTGACCLTFRGHTNEKNFVGLSVANGFITCGSETNEVFTYYKSLPMPISSLKFGSINQISGKETNDDNGQFVSSVCWRGKSDMVVAANSIGTGWSAMFDRAFFFFNSRAVMKVEASELEDNSERMLGSPGFEWVFDDWEGQVFTVVADAILQLRNFIMRNVHIKD